MNNYLGQQTNTHFSIQYKTYEEKKSDVNENKTTTDTTVAEDSKTVENKTTENKLF